MKPSRASEPARPGWTTRSPAVTAETSDEAQPLARLDGRSRARPPARQRLQRGAATRGRDRGPGGRPVSRWAGRQSAGDRRAGGAAVRGAVPATARQCPADRRAARRGAGRRVGPQQPLGRRQPRPRRTAWSSPGGGRSRCTTPTWDWGTRSPTGRTTWSSSASPSCCRVWRSAADPKALCAWAMGRVGRAGAQRLDLTGRAIQSGPTWSLRTSNHTTLPNGSSRTPQRAGEHADDLEPAAVQRVLVARLTRRVPRVVVADLDVDRLPPGRHLQPSLAAAVDEGVGHGLAGEQYGGVAGDGFGACRHAGFLDQVACLAHRGGLRGEHHRPAQHFSVLGHATPKFMAASPRGAPSKGKDRRSRPGWGGFRTKCPASSSLGGILACASSCTGRGH